MTTSDRSSLPLSGRPPRVAHIVLAAGASRRMGSPKALCRIGDETFVERIVRAGRTAGLAPLVITLGPDADAIERGADLSGCRLAHNPDPASGPLASLQIALDALDAPVDAAVVGPVDQPLVTAELLRELCAAFARTGAPIVAPSYGGRRGHPTLFAARLFDELRSAPRDVGARAVVRAHEAEIALVPADERALADVDTPGDLTAAAEMDRLRRTPIVRYREGTPGLAGEDEVAVEEPLELRLNGAPLAVLMRTPGHDLDLARGFLLTEGVLCSAGELRALRRVAPNVLDATVEPAIARGRADARTFFATSSCGVCGKASLQSLALRSPPVRSDARLAREVLVSLPDRLAAAQAVFARTGGLHAAALFSVDGALAASREDVGRHNAVDKLVGWALAGGAPLPLAEHVLAVSGRTSFEVLQKAIAAGVPIVAAVSAPSSLAVRLAAELGVTLVGFLRGGSFNVYAHPERVVG